MTDENTEYFDCDPELDEAECEKQAMAWLDGLNEAAGN